jgi:hypothetical protein
MESDPVFWNQPRIDRLYLDTTYCQPQYDFPAQELVIQASVFEEILCLNSRKISLEVWWFLLKLVRPSCRHVKK